MHSSYDLSGTRLRLTGDERILDLLKSTLAPIQRVPSSATDFRCELVVGIPDETVPGANTISTGYAAAFDGHFILEESNGERRYILPGQGSLTASFSDRTASIVVQVDHLAHNFAGELFMHLLDWVLAADSRSLVHGAALVDPAGERGLLLFGPSGAGKTTLALALLQSGFQLFSDDLAILDQIGGTPRIGGIPRSLKVHRHTATLLPWTVKYLGPKWDANDEQPINSQKTAAIGTLRKEPAGLAALVHLRGYAPGSAEFNPISAPIALVRLCEENVRAGNKGVPHFERDAFRRLGAVVSSVRTYELVAGERPETTVAKVTELISPE